MVWELKQRSLRLNFFAFVLVKERTQAGRHDVHPRIVMSLHARSSASMRWKPNYDRLELHLVSRNVRGAHALLGASTFSRSRPHLPPPHCESRKQQEAEETWLKRCTSSAANVVMLRLLVLLVLMVTLLIRSRHSAEVRISLSGLVAALLCV